MTENVEGVNHFINVKGKLVDVNSITIQQLMLLLMNERIDTLGTQSAKELKELTERQRTVTELNNVKAAINAETNKDDSSLTVNADTELAGLLKRAEEIGVKMPKIEGTFDAEERRRLVDNLNMTLDDLNTKNDMQLQMVTRYTNERYEAYQMGRTIIKAPDDAVKSSARRIAG